MFGIVLLAVLLIIGMLHASGNWCQAYR
jgi:hypothetical protein